MPDLIDKLIQKTLNAIGDHRDEKSVVSHFGHKFAGVYRKRTIGRRIKWLSLGSLGAAPLWWPEDWALGDVAISLFEAFQRLFVTPSLIESAIDTIKSILA